jgi:hypothetical protein
MKEFNELKALIPKRLYDVINESVENNSISSPS